MPTRRLTVPYLAVVFPCGTPPFTAPALPRSAHASPCLAVRSPCSAERHAAGPCPTLPLPCVARRDHAAALPHVAVRHLAGAVPHDTAPRLADAPRRHTRPRRTLPMPRGSGLRLNDAVPHIALSFAMPPRHAALPHRAFARLSRALLICAVASRRTHCPGRASLEAALHNAHTSPKQRNSTLDLARTTPRLTMPQPGHA